MQSIYSVSQINSYIKNMFTQDFLLKQVKIRGEISKVTYHHTGHIYFTIKDEGAVINCVMYSSNTNSLTFKMREGQLIVCSGSVTVYERDGKYQMIARSIVQEGAGDLYAEFLKLKESLDEMGMFAEEYKQPIPRFVKRIGVVTAPTGAAIRDIIQISKRRNPYIEIVLYPSLVQGENAAESICKGISMLDRDDIDLMIVGRGGGSIEDLWCFNERIVAEAIFNCSTPVISAVGHETDFTIADFVADHRAPTPSAAAELAVTNIVDIIESLKQSEQMLNRNIDRVVTEKKNQVINYSLKLKALSPEATISERKQRTKEALVRLEQLMQGVLDDRKKRLAIDAERLKGLSPLEKLSQGYAWVSDENGKNVNDIHNINVGDKLNINVKNGIIKGTVSEVCDG